MESTRSQQIQVGLFIALGLIAILASILILGGDKAVFKSYARIFVKMAQVQGLNRGSIVSLAGVKIGNVEQITFAAEDANLVLEMKVESQFLDRIPNDTLVEVRTQGALGDKYVYLIPGSLQSPKVESGGYLQPNNAPDLMGVISERGGEAGKIFDILTELKKVLASVNGDGRLDRIMINLQETTNEMKTMSKETRQLLTDLRGDNPAKLKQSLEKLNSILTKVDKGEGTLGALINDPSLHQQLKALLGESPRRQYLQSVIRSAIEKSDSK